VSKNEREGGERGREGEREREREEGEREGETYMLVPNIFTKKEGQQQSNDLSVVSL
jgi:hypothetical protein